MYRMIKKFNKRCIKLKLGWFDILDLQIFSLDTAALEQQQCHENVLPNFWVRVQMEQYGTRI